MSAIGAAAISGGAAILGGAINNGMSQSFGSQAREENYIYNEYAAENADARTRALYNDLQSPKALLQQYQEAGLSPSLMFGGSGQGAQPSQGAQGNGTQGPLPQTYGIDLQGATMQGAQIELMKAEANKAQSEADLNNNYKGGEIEANIEYMLSQAGVNNAKEESQRLENYKTKALLETDIEAVKTNLELLHKQSEWMTYKIASAEANAQVDMATIQERIRQVDLNNQEILQKINESISRIELNDAEKQRIIYEINKWATEIAQRNVELEIEKARQGSYAEYVTAMSHWQNEQINIASERLKHDINIDWSRYGLDVTKLITEVFQFHEGQFTQQLGMLLKSSDKALNLLK